MLFISHKIKSQIWGGGMQLWKSCNWKGINYDKWDKFANIAAVVSLSGSFFRLKYLWDKFLNKKKYYSCDIWSHHLINSYFWDIMLYLSIIYNKLYEAVSIVAYGNLSEKKKWDSVK